MPEQAEAKRDGVMNPLNYNFNQCLLVLGILIIGIRQMEAREIYRNKKILNVEIRTHRLYF